MKCYLLVILLTLSSLPSVGQSNVDGLLVKLNKIHKTSRLLSTGTVQEIFINKTDKTIDVHSIIIPLNKYTSKYINEYHPSFKKKIDMVLIRCIEGNCLNNGENSGAYIFFKTKKACYDFINALDEIREVLKD